MKSLPIKGIRSLSLIDYPGRLASVVFFGGCNFKCPFCHNFDIAVFPEKFPDLDTETVLEELSRRKKLNDGVVLTGGEPTLIEGIEDFAKALKVMGYEIKLDTNGYRPEVLEKFISQRLADFVSMDIKASLNPEAYSKAAGVRVEMEKIFASIEILSRGGISFEFRTTMIDPFVTPKEIRSIAQRLQNSGPYFLQTANLSHTAFTGPSEEELKELAVSLKQEGFSVFAR